jgi:hypothetical protein
MFAGISACRTTAKVNAFLAASGWTNPMAAGSHVAVTCRKIPIVRDVLVYLKKDLNGVEIGTCVSVSEGESIDWPLAVGHPYQ